MDNHAEKLVLRGKIIAMFESGQNKTQIARNLGIHVSTVRRWIVRHEEEGNLCDRPKPGGPRKTTLNEDQQIIQETIRNPFTNSRAIKRALELEACDRTIRRRLHENGIHHRTPAVKQKLTEAHKTERLRFAREYINNDMNFWSKVIFTDEKTFSSTDHGPLHCWRVNNTRYEQQHIYEEARSGHVTANVWGWINFNILGELTLIDGRFTSDKYLEILEVFLPTVRVYLDPDPDRIPYVHDNSPVHTARRVQQWFTEHEQIFDVLPWPPRGCDLNPIENIWGAIIREWTPEEERTERQLLHHALRSWEIQRRTPHILENNIASMPDRLQSVINNEGGWTKY
ncbi:UNVERIFIED_CONTAM: hypothetical protein RMT77_002202 [Armadillidium vulgare]